MCRQRGLSSVLNKELNEESVLEEERDHQRAILSFLIIELDKECVLRRGGSP